MHPCFVSRGAELLRDSLACRLLAVPGEPGHNLWPGQDMFRLWSAEDTVAKAQDQRI